LPNQVSEKRERTLLGVVFRPQARADTIDKRITHGAIVPGDPQGSAIMRVCEAVVRIGIPHEPPWRVAAGRWLEGGEVNETDTVETDAAGGRVGR
jgi:hypothetical protein